MHSSLKNSIFLFIQSSSIPCSKEYRPYSSPQISISLKPLQLYTPSEAGPSNVNSVIFHRNLPPLNNSFFGIGKNLSLCRSKFCIFPYIHLLSMVPFNELAVQYSTRTAHLHHIAFTWYKQRSELLYIPVQKGVCKHHQEIPQDASILCGSVRQHSPMVCLHPTLNTPFLMEAVSPGNPIQLLI